MGARRAEAAGIETVLLASPLTPDERLAALCERSRGFVYGVNLLGVTGERTDAGRHVDRAGQAAEGARPTCR